MLLPGLYESWSANNLEVNGAVPVKGEVLIPNDRLLVARFTNSVPRVCQCY
jgi:hypothetical protein